MWDALAFLAAWPMHPFARTMVEALATSQSR